MADGIIICNGNLLGVAACEVLCSFAEKTKREIGVEKNRKRIGEVEADE
jgi:hypothetical protein